MLVPVLEPGRCGCDSLGDRAALVWSEKALDQLTHPELVRQLVLGDELYGRTRSPSSEELSVRRGASGIWIAAALTACSWYARHATLAADDRALRLVGARATVNRHPHL
jgi:hypothetical protein